ncbi:MAG: hypothetical protein VKI42_10140 [Synechococcaceae cyanobacterium]|nr:hypothetical protein [Synechococcaceae cyanobacterium]
MASSSTPAARAPHTGQEGSAAAPVQAPQGAAVALEQDPILCGHCGRSASNGLSCIGMCVADSGY